MFLYSWGLAACCFVLLYHYFLMLSIFVLCYRSCRPKLLSHKGQLYILGCKVDRGDDKGASSSQFGVIFDPRTDSWDAIAMPDVDFLNQPSFSVAFIRGHLLLMLTEPLILDNLTGQWRPLPPYTFSTDNGEWLDHTADPHLNVPDIISTLVEVEEESTVYWISNIGRIYAHSLDTHKTQFGPIIGLEYTHFLNSLLDGQLDISLFHVMGDLFCLLYQDPMSNTGTSDLHCLITRVIKLKSSIFMIVVGCFCAPISGAFCFRNSFLL